MVIAVILSAGVAIRKMPIDIIKEVESRSIQGVSLIKLVFYLNARHS
jgi:hypothetical protein